jgi:hypothetical protein
METSRGDRPDDAAVALADPAARRPWPAEDAPDAPGLYALYLWRSEDAGSPPPAGPMESRPLHVGASAGLRDALGPLVRLDAPAIRGVVEDLRWFAALAGAVPPPAPAVLPVGVDEVDRPAVADWAAYASAALDRWRRTHVRVAWVGTDTPDAAEAVRADVVAALAPLVDGRSLPVSVRDERMVDVLRPARPEAVSDAIRARAMDVALRAAPALVAVPPDRWLSFGYTDGPFGLEWPDPDDVEAVTGESDADDRYEFPGAALVGEERGSALAASRPSAWYARGARAVHGTPPPWVDVLAGLGEERTRALVFAEHLTRVQMVVRSLFDEGHGGA